MRLRKLIRICMIFMVLVSPARAEVLVLVHGWSADAGTWVYSGVMSALESRGWRSAGVVVSAPGGAVFLPTAAPATEHSVYLVQLMAEAPLQVQAAQLSDELRLIRQRHPDEVLTLVGHSAGGLVARLVLVSPSAPRIDRLITIATPNLGTVRALQGLDLVDSKPFFCPGPGIDILKTVIGGDDYRYLKDSYPVLVDMQPAVPGNLIDWLNHQPHPAIDYHAVIRTSPGFAGDELVPAYSQDLNRVASLNGHVKLHITPAGHALNPNDGLLIAAIVSSGR